MSPLRRGAHEHVPGHVYHWRHGWVPLDPTSAARMRHARADYLQ